jgi:hypothetical protein
VSEGDRRAAVALLYGTALSLIMLAAVALAVGLFSPGDHARSALVALVASGGGLFLLGVGVVRSSRAARSGG